MGDTYNDPQDLDSRFGDVPQVNRAIYPSNRGSTTTYTPTFIPGMGGLSIPTGSLRVNTNLPSYDELDAARRIREQQLHDFAIRELARARTPSSQDKVFQTTVGEGTRAVRESGRVATEQLESQLSAAGLSDSPIAGNVYAGLLEQQSQGEHQVITEATKDWELRNMQNEQAAIDRVLQVFGAEAAYGRQAQLTERQIMSMFDIEQMRFDQQKTLLEMQQNQGFWGSLGELVGGIFNLGLGSKLGLFDTDTSTATPTPTLSQPGPYQPAGGYGSYAATSAPVYGSY